MSSPKRRKLENDRSASSEADDSELSAEGPGGEDQVPQDSNRAVSKSFKDLV